MYFRQVSLIMGLKKAKKPTSQSTEKEEREKTFIMFQLAGRQS
jgi:hypothetical protein